MIFEAIGENWELVGKSTIYRLGMFGRGATPSLVFRKGKWQTYFNTPVPKSYWEVVRAAVGNQPMLIG